MTPNQAIHDLTLALLYLNRFVEPPADFWSSTEFRAWKGYDFEALNHLNDEGLIEDKHRNKSLWITEEGVAEAKRILEQLGIEDWKPEEDASQDK